MSGQRIIQITPDLHLGFITRKPFIVPALRALFLIFITLATKSWYRVMEHVIQSEHLKPYRNKLTNIGIAVSATQD